MYTTFHYILNIGSLCLGPVSQRVIVSVLKVFQNFFKRLVSPESPVSPISPVSPVSPVFKLFKNSFKTFENFQLLPVFGLISVRSCLKTTKTFSIHFLGLRPGGREACEQAGGTSAGPAGGKRSLSHNGSDHTAKHFNRNICTFLIHLLSTAVSAGLG